MEGKVFDIQHFSTHDGPGIRTTVFLKGCPLHCAWCHNPESQHTYPEILFHKVRCIGCGTCDAVCPQSSCHLLEQNNETFNGKVHQLLSSHQNRKQYCTDCSLCAESCPTQALELCGKSMPSSQVLEEVMKDEAYYRLSSIEESDKSVTCGGVTLSGGEPLMQFDFTLEILKELHGKGVHTAIETSGNAPLEHYQKVLEHTDLVIWDIKLMDNDLYRQYTGGNLQLMLDNLEQLYIDNKTKQFQQNKARNRFLFRLLFIPEIHLKPQVMETTRRLLKKLSPCQFEVMPYHLLGNDKREKLGLQPIRFQQPTDDELKIFLDYLN